MRSGALDWVWSAETTPLCLALGGHEWSSLLYCELMEVLTLSKQHRLLLLTDPGVVGGSVTESVSFRERNELDTELRPKLNGCGFISGRSTDDCETLIELEVCEITSSVTVMVDPALDSCCLSLSSNIEPLLNSTAELGSISEHRMK